MKTPATKSLLSFLCTLLLVGCCFAQSDRWERITDLRGRWQFSIGDDAAWADPLFNDDAWERMFVPAKWEDEGYPGYDGIAWYRKTFRLRDLDPRATLYLHLGRIDDADQVYVNGHYIGGSGRFKPGYETAYNVFREYRVPTEYLKVDGENVIAVRVYDHQLEGGIVEGRIGLYRDRDAARRSVDLTGIWQFQLGDREEWRRERVSKEGWEPLTVPARWDEQGYDDYDGVAWYRKRFYMPEDLEEEDLVLVLGRIDDLDETFLNGELIGQTGRMRSRPVRRDIEGHEWLVERAYPISKAVIRFGGYNTIAVRVYDGLDRGGIYEGPVAIMTEREYRRHREDQPRPFWERWFQERE